MGKLKKFFGLDKEENEADSSKEEKKSNNNIGISEKDSLNDVFEIFNVDLLDEQTFPKDSKKIKYYFKRTIEKKLVVVLVENTNQMEGEIEVIQKISKNAAQGGYIYVLNYSNTLSNREICSADSFDFASLFCKEQISSETCLFDAINELNSIITNNYNKIVIETETNKILFNEIEIIGIGRCIDTCSKTTFQKSAETLFSISSKENISTKYFCFDESGFINASALGFRSIGAINRNYI